jgi:dTDP-4-dehydrorhamnose 3,5-epimerase
MEISKTHIEGLVVITPKVFNDERGYFFESWNKEIFEKNGIVGEFSQDNQSLSMNGVLRGLHLQNPPYQQGKLVRVIKGSVMDVAVDIRKDSPTYGEHQTIYLSGENKKMFWIPPGFAHGFVTLEDNTIFSYKCTNVYNKESEVTLSWDDEDLNVDWCTALEVRVSEKDEQGIKFKNFKTKF